MVRKRRKSHLRRDVQEELIKYFCAGVAARAAAEVSGVNRNAAILFYHRLREVVFDALTADAAELLAGEIEVDESYLGGHRKGRRGRRAAGKVPVFGLLKRQGKVYVAIIAHARSGTLIPIIRDKVRSGSVVYTDAFGSYDVLDLSGFHHMRINRSKRSTGQRDHINGIENFWNQAKRHLRSYNGIPGQHFPLFIKECEWRFNHRPIGRMQATPMERWFR